MITLREAASGLLNAVETAIEAGDWKVDGACDPTVEIIRLKNALAKPQVQWIEDGFGTMWQKCGKKDCGKFVVKIGKVDCWNGDCPETNAPPKRKWVGLTDDDFNVKQVAEFDVAKFAQYIEAILKERNCGTS